MQFRNGEYQITEDSICIKKSVLEAWRDHYREVSKRNKDIPFNEDWQGCIYMGKADVLVDILKHFDDLDG